MKISLNWLKEFVDIGMSVEELSNLLTMAGVEVAGTEPVGQNLRDIIAARIIEVKPHPNAERLVLCEVDTGSDRIPVVCGAPNVAEGCVAPLALPGVRLPDNTKIRRGKIRGEISEGVLLAEDELGLTDDHTGIMLLPRDTEPGISLPDVLPVADWVLDLELTPNRPDCASVMGIAREIAASTGQKLRIPGTDYEEKGPPIGDLTHVTIDDPRACPRYSAGVVQGVDIAPSPFILRYRLYLSDIRPINNIVDITNYVMLEMGQPLHAFDFNRLHERRIVVRFAREGETFTTLDGKTHILDGNTLVICDANGPVALAGIMGGMNSEISEDTTDILLESAFFDPVTIRRASKRMGISTEASYRFERGADIGGTDRALRRAIHLISSLAGGTVAKGIVDNYEAPRILEPITLRVEKANRFLGTDLSTEKVKEYLEGLDMSVETGEGQDLLSVTPPSFRVDITREADLFEEIARMYGYNNIPVTIPRVQPPAEGDPPELPLQRRIRQVMEGAGFCEVVTYSFISPSSADYLSVPEDSPVRSFVKILNPLSSDQSVMRTTLIHGLLTVAESNMSRGVTGLKLFELGKVFFHRENEPLPLEELKLTAIMTGNYQDKSWYAPERKVDFFDIKGALEVFFEALGLEDFYVKKEEGIPSWYDPDISAGIIFSEKLVGHLGRLKPEVVNAYGLGKRDAFAFEVDLGGLVEPFNRDVKFRPFPKYPAVYRDISILVSKETPSADLLKIIEEKGGDLVESVKIFDVYEGNKIGASEKAIAVNICYRSSEGTLDGETVNRLHESIIERIREETGGRLREG